MRVLITGSNGFIGSSLFSQLSHDNISVTPTVRSLTRKGPKGAQQLDLSLPNYSSILEGHDCIVHCAAKTSTRNNIDEHEYKELVKVNVEGTLDLAKAAADIGVKRFVFISSIKVLGDQTLDGEIFKSDTVCKPKCSYGKTKLQAERGLLAISQSTGMEVVIIRPALVYGEGAKGNFLSLMNLVNKGVPLPFSMITNNRRSMVSLNNLVDLIKICIDHPNAAGHVFIASDGEDISTNELVKKMSKSFGKHDRQWPVPLWLFRILARVANKEDVLWRLIGSLQVDNSLAIKLLSWHPDQSVDDALNQYVRNLRV